MYHFFNLFVQWQWPNPLLISPPESNSDQMVRNLPIWNPKLNVKDGHHLMPIITPAYPSMNSSYNVGIPQFRLIQEEILRAQHICQQLLACTRIRPINENEIVCSWEELFQSATDDFFRRHPRYIQLEVKATSAEDHRAWFGWCESRLRSLFLSLEQPPLIFSHPQANCFHRHMKRDSIDGVETETLSSSASSSFSPSSTLAQSKVVGYSSSFFIGLSFRSGLKCVDVNPAIHGFVTRVNSWENRKNGMELFISAHTKNTIPSFVHSTIAAPSRTSGCTPTRDTTNRPKFRAVHEDSKDSRTLGYVFRDNENFNMQNTNNVIMQSPMEKKSAESRMEDAKSIIVAKSDGLEDPQAQFAEFLVGSFGVDFNSNTNINQPFPRHL